MKVKVCFKCHEFIPVLEPSHLNKEEIEAFDKKHAGHAVQIVKKEELERMGGWKKKIF
jgi:hypothetical protein